MKTLKKNALIGNWWIRVHALMEYYELLELDKFIHFENATYRMGETIHKPYNWNI